MSADTKTLPCPLCGSQPSFKERLAKHQHGQMYLTNWRLRCWGESQTAGYHAVEVGPFRTKQEAIDRWNKRP